MCSVFFRGYGRLANNDKESTQFHLWYKEVSCIWTGIIHSNEKSGLSLAFRNNLTTWSITTLAQMYTHSSTFCINKHGQIHITGTRIHTVWNALL